MESPWYRGTGEPWPGDGPPALPQPLAERFTRPEDYLADEGLVDAVNVALHLGQPLLLTGQPGTGKTQLAYSLAHELRLGDGTPLKFETKSTSAARDLFYTYDALGRFHAAQTGGPVGALEHIQWMALGRAILHVNDPQRVAHLLDPAKHPGRRRSLVLVDEIDKAPRDFPNDLLNEVEHMYFRIPELGSEPVRADPDLRPVLVLTSNSEKNLAEAFLRRCVFYYIPFPTRERLEQIVRRRLGAALGGDGLLASSLDLFERLRDPALGLLKTPSTGELLAWMQDLAGGPPAAGERLVERTLCALIKTREDRDRARPEVARWAQDRKG